VTNFLLCATSACVIEGLEKMRFYIVFASVVTLTILSGFCALLIAMKIDVSQNLGAKSVMDTSTFLFSAGMGTIIGLLGGSKMAGGQ